MDESERIKKVVKDFEDISINLATQFGTVDYEEYESIRSNLINEPILRSVIPDWIMKNRYGSQFWEFIKKISPNYAGRRKYIYESIGEIFNFIEWWLDGPVSISVREVSGSLENKNIENLWRKIQSRGTNDSEGVITASRTMLETTLKYILDKLNEPYANENTLPQLYKKVWAKLNLSPWNHNEHIFKEILSGITSVVNGFSALRNEYWDAHGKGKYNAHPDKRHADLASNLSWAICVFLLETFDASLK